jgi:hypothetical protein
MRTEMIETAMLALQSELERVGGDLSRYDRERPLKTLIDDGMSPDEASEAIDAGEETLGFWK